MKTKKCIKPYIRWMIRRDMPEVLQIERECSASPWEEEDFMVCLRQRNTIGMVAEYGDKVVGFMIYELHKRKLVLELVGVKKTYQRAGVGRSLIEKIKGKLSSHRRDRITIMVRESNLPMCHFLKANEFEAVRVDREYFTDPVEDAYAFIFRV